jgi:predicted AlkP superfamily pyrophosphatase or phosphodiesterase
MKIICLDGFKPEYINHTNYLKSLSKNYLHGDLETVFCFTGISASFFTGLYPNKHNIFTMFEFSKKHFTPKLPKPFLTISKNIIRLLKNKRFFYKYYNIPNYALKYFKPALDKIWYQKKVINHKTIFDYLRENKISFSYIDFPNFFDGKNYLYFNKSDKSTLSKIKKSKSKVCFAFLHELDSLSHKYGPNSKKVIKHVKFLDSELKKIKEDLIIWSDHGFLKTKGKINLNQNLAIVEFIK